MRIKDAKNGLSVTRRGFLAGLAGAGATAALYGCAGKGATTTYAGAGPETNAIPYDDKAFIYGTSAHNCGGRCIIRGQVENGKIIRFVTDENEFGKGFINGQTISGKIDPESPNNTQARACSRCRSYRFRLYHAGRLKYPMKQTKKRGDLSGFVRISWDQALKEIAEKHKATFEKYGPDAMYVNYASAIGGSQGSAAIWGPVLNLIGGSVAYWGSYSTHQWRYCVNGYSGFPQQVNSTGQGYSTDYTGNSYHGNCNDIGQDTKNVVMWGSNYMTTYHQYAYATLRALENMKARYKNDPTGGNAIFVGPSFVDQGVTVATEWFQIKPYTDPAMITAMIYEMIINTFNADGSLKPEKDRWLDVDYLDTMVYGFFDSPEYWIDQDTGEIYLTKPSNKQQYWVPITRTGGMTGFKNVKIDWSQKVTANTRPAIPAIPKDTSNPYVFDWIEGIRRVDAVPAGRSLSAYVMGDDDRLTKARYSSSKNYVANVFASKGLSRNGSVCSYNIKGKKATKSTQTDYKTKADFLTPKTPAWAEAITGVKKEDITRMARFYADEKNHPIYSEWCGGLQKQANGVTNLVILQMFLVISKCWGQPGNGWGRGIENASIGIKASDAIGNPNFTGIPGSPQTPIPSCTAWHNAIKMAYADDLKKNGYTAKYVPDYKEIGTPYIDDGGTKALLTWSRGANGKVELLPPDKEGNVFYKWKGAKPQYSGFRFIVNAGGNILVNQHECSNDLVDMWEKLPLCDSGPDSLCIVTLDNFLSPTPRWSDYVLPAATTWEQPTVIKPFHGSNMYIPTVTTPPGESKSQFDSGLEFLKAYETVSGKTGLAKTYTWGKDGMTVEDKVKENFDTVSKSPTSPFFGKTWEEFLTNPYVPAIPDEKKKIMANPNAKLRTDMDAYLAGPMDKPFKDSIDNKGVYIVTYHSAEGVESPCQGSYGNDYPRFNLPSKTLPEVKTVPSPSGRFQVYSGLYVWQYEWKFSKWHGHLPANERGQKNRDLEGDPIVYPIPMYFAYEDYFMEAYGGKPVELFKKYDSFGPLLMTTTHNRFRSHSTYAEVGYLRELTHRTVKGTKSNTDGVNTIVDGGLYSGNDWGEYGLSSPLSGDMKINQGGTIPRLNKAIEYKQDNATYSEFWINVDDAAERGIEDGDLLLVQNPVGAVRVVARVTHRSAKGYCDLNQGCWFDPGPDGIDDGGNCNTLMAQKHSYIDHGNGQQSAMVSVTKVK